MVMFVFVMLSHIMIMIQTVVRQIGLGWPKCVCSDKSAGDSCGLLNIYVISLQGSPGYCKARRGDVNRPEMLGQIAFMYRLLGSLFAAHTLS
jgi:hypothetical protein